MSRSLNLERRTNLLTKVIKSLNGILEEEQNLNCFCLFKEGLREFFNARPLVLYLLAVVARK